jgi:hypothetical protein
MAYGDGFHLFLFNDLNKFTAILTTNSFSDTKIKEHRPVDLRFGLRTAHDL